MKGDCACGLRGLSAHWIDLRQKPKDLQAWNSCKSVAEASKMKGIFLRGIADMLKLWKDTEFKTKAVFHLLGSGALGTWKWLKHFRKAFLLRLQFRVCCEGRKQSDLQLESRGEKSSKNGEKIWRKSEMKTSKISPPGSSTSSFRGFRLLGPKWGEKIPKLGRVSSFSIVASHRFATSLFYLFCPVVAMTVNNIGYCSSEVFNPCHHQFKIRYSIWSMWVVCYPPPNSPMWWPFGERGFKVYQKGPGRGGNQQRWQKLAKNSKLKGIVTKLCSVMAVTTIHGFVVVWLLVTCVLSVILLHLVAVVFLHCFQLWAFVLARLVWKFFRCWRTRWRGREKATKRQKWLKFE